MSFNFKTYMIITYKSIKQLSKKKKKKSNFYELTRLLKLMTNFAFRILLFNQKIIEFVLIVKINLTRISTFMQF